MFNLVSTELCVSFSPPARLRPAHLLCLPFPSVRRHPHGSASLSLSLSLAATALGESVLAGHALGPAAA
jgi:hypothetical protein